MVGQQVHHHHGKAGARSDEHDVAGRLDQLKAEIARRALGRRQGPFGQHVAQRKLAGVVAKLGCLVTDELGVAGDEAAVGRERQRIDFQELQVLLPGDLGQTRGVTGKSGCEIAWKQIGRRGEDVLRCRRRVGLDGNARQFFRRPLDVFAAFRRQQQLKSLVGPVDADGNEDLVCDRDGLFEQ